MQLTYFFHPLILFIRQRNNMKIPTLPIQLVAARVARGVHRVVHVGPGTDAVDTPGRAISRQESRFDSTSKTNISYWMTIQDLTQEMELLCMLFQSCLSNFISGVQSCLANHYHCSSQNEM